MSLTIPHRNPRQTRLLVIACGAFLFLWLHIEDNSIFPAVAAGFMLTLVTAAIWLNRHFGGRTLALRLFLPAAALVGAVGGLGTSAATALLMLLKSGMHGHVFPDYPFGVIVEIVQRAPLWALAGALACFGLVLAWVALKPSPQPPQTP